jgi:hypothetical protein
LATAAAISSARAGICSMAPTIAPAQASIARETPSTGMSLAHLQPVPLDRLGRFQSLGQRINAIGHASEARRKHSQ